MLSFFAALVALISTPAFATPLPVLDPLVVEAQMDACAAAAEDPLASYTVSDDVATLYAGNSLATFLATGNAEMQTSQAGLSVSANAEGKAALVTYRACMVGHHLSPALLDRMNGDLGLFEEDMIAGGMVYNVEAALYYPDGRFALGFAPDDSGTCETVYVLGIVADGQAFVTTDKWYRPAKPDDPGYEMQICESGAACSGKCELQYAPNGAGGVGGDPIFLCLCKEANGSIGGNQGCQGGVKPGEGSFEASDWQDGNGDGVGDGGMWGGFVL